MKNAHWFKLALALTAFVMACDGSSTGCGAGVFPTLPQGSFTDSQPPVTACAAIPLSSGRGASAVHPASAAPAAASAIVRLQYLHLRNSFCGAIRGA